MPPLETQKRIASILSAYDDLIENNLKRIKLLEETAQNIYKELVQQNNKLKLEKQKLLDSTSFKIGHCIVSSLSFVLKIIKLKILHWLVIFKIDLFLNCKRTDPTCLIFKKSL